MNSAIVTSFCFLELELSQLIACRDNKQEKENEVNKIGERIFGYTSRRVFMVTAAVKVDQLFP